MKCRRQKKIKDKHRTETNIRQTQTLDGDKCRTNTNIGRRQMQDKDKHRTETNIRQTQTLDRDKYKTNLRNYMLCFNNWVSVHAHHQWSDSMQFQCTSPGFIPPRSQVFSMKQLKQDRSIENQRSREVERRGRNGSVQFYPPNYKHRRGQEDSLDRGRPPVQQDTVQGKCTAMYLTVSVQLLLF